MTFVVIPNGNKVYAYNVGCMKSYMDYTPCTLKEIMEGVER